LHISLIHKLSTAEGSATQKGMAIKQIQKKINFGILEKISNIGGKLELIDKRAVASITSWYVNVGILSQLILTHVGYMWLVEMRVFQIFTMLKKSLAFYLSDEMIKAMQLPYRICSHN